MAKFFYKMQNILNIKLKLETQAKNEYAVANAELAEEEEKLETFKRRKSEYENRLTELYSDKLDSTLLLFSLESMKFRIPLT